MASLPTVPDITKLSSRVIRILGQNGPSKFVLQGTNTYLIGSGPQRILLDTGEGVPQYTELLKSVLEEQKCTISIVVLSHWHHDHVDGLPSVRRLISGFRPSSEALKVLKFPHSDDEPDWVQLRDLDEIKVTGATMRAIHTPGHTTDHLAFHLLEDDSLFTADHILGGSTSVFEDLGAYMSSLRKLQQIDARVLYPGHGLEIHAAKATIQGYLDHRQAREDQIVQVLRGSKSWTPMEIVRVVYKDVREDLYFAAEHGVRQHLDKLSKENKVAENEDGAWKLTNTSRI